MTGRRIAGRQTATAFGLALATGGSVLLGSVAFAAGGKVTICHRTHSTTNPYRKISVSVSAVNGSSANDHSHHTGSVFDPTYAYPPNQKKWGDIIPDNASGGAGTGLNWQGNPAGQAMYAGPYCMGMTAQQFYNTEREAGVPHADVIADLQEQRADEDAGVTFTSMSYTGSDPSVSGGGDTSSASPSPSASAAPSESASPAESPGESPSPSESAAPSDPPESASPEPSPAESASESVAPSESASPEASPSSSPEPEESASPEPSESPVESSSSEASESPSAETSHEPLESAAPSESAEPSESASPEASPAASESVVPELPLPSESEVPGGGPLPPVTQRVQGTVWLDLDADGARDGGEPGIPAVGVSVSAPGLTRQAGTSQAGGFRFDDLAPGAYRVQAGVPASLRVTRDSAGAPDGIADLVLPAGGVGTAWIGLVGDARVSAEVVDVGGRPYDGPVLIRWAGPDGLPGTADDVVVEAVAVGGKVDVGGLPAGAYVLSAGAARLATTLTPGATAALVLGARQTAPEARPATLPRTGGPLADAVPMALTLLAAGAASLRAARRRDQS